MFNKKAISPVVATALLLVVAVVAVVGFQGWYETFSSNLFVNAEQDSANLDGSSPIEKIIGDTLYLKAGNNLTVDSVKIDGNDCGINGTFQGTTGIDVSSCLSQTTSSTPEIVLITDDKVESKSVYLDKTTQSFQQTFTTNPLADPQCYSAPINTIGLWEGCNGTLLVDRSMITAAVTNNDSINGGSDYYIEFSGINYTFGDSENNIFTGQITNMSQLFEGTFSVRNDFNSDINYWDMSNVLDISEMFELSFFNQPVYSWNTSKVETLERTFYNAESFNQDINSWDVGSVKNLDLLFVGADAFNQPLNNWDVSSVVSMSGTFSFAPSFNQPLNNWDVGNVVDMRGMFRAASSFNQNINSWNVSSVENMYRMFSYTPLFNQPLNNWDVSSVVSMADMFVATESFNQDINSWNVSNVLYMADMFQRSGVFNQPLDQWDTSNVTNMRWMFHHSSFNQNINSWDVSSVEMMLGMFENATLFNQPLNNWTVSSVTDMRDMFKDTSSFNQNISTWDVSAVTLCSNFDLNATSWSLPSSRPALDVSCLS